MTQEQKSTLEAAKAAEQATAIVDFTDEQLAAAIEFNWIPDLSEIATKGAAQEIKNKLRGIMNQAVLGKDKAFRKGQHKVVEALEAEYQKAHGYLIKL